MDFLDRMNQVIDYIEQHLEDDIDYSNLANIVCCSVYQFGRIFSYVVGVPLSEYIRRRKLSQAAMDLQGTDKKIIDIALKYGYNSPDSFTRAFQSMHGITPREARAYGAKLRLYPRISFHISIKGDTEMEYRIEKTDVIHCVGIERNFGKLVINKNAENWKKAKPDVWKYWDHFLDHGENRIIRDVYKLYRPPFYQLGYNELLENGDTVVHIGAQAREGEAYPDLTRFTIPANTWAVFPAKGTLDQKDHPIAQTLARIMTEWLPTSGYELLKGRELEVYGPGDTRLDSYICELWLPVKKAN